MIQKIGKFSFVLFVSFSFSRRTRRLASWSIVRLGALMQIMKAIPGHLTEEANSLMERFLKDTDQKMKTKLLPLSKSDFESLEKFTTDWKC
jgi:hypothetical protein